MALSAAVSEAIWLRGLLVDLGVQFTEPTKIFEDNRGCIGMATNLECKRSKHIDIKHHFIRDYIAEGTIDVQPIGTDEQLADIFTKSLDWALFKKFCNKIGIND